MKPAKSTFRIGGAGAVGTGSLALRMAEHVADLKHLTAAPAGDPRRLEGAVWRPPASAPGHD